MRYTRRHLTGTLYITNTNLSPGNRTLAESEGNLQRMGEGTHPTRLPQRRLLLHNGAGKACPHPLKGEIQALLPGSRRGQAWTSPQPAASVRSVMELGLVKDRGVADSRNQSVTAWMGTVYEVQGTS